MTECGIEAGRARFEDAQLHSEVAEFARIQPQKRECATSKRANEGMSPQILRWRVRLHCDRE